MLCAQLTNALTGSSRHLLSKRMYIDAGFHLEILFGVEVDVAIYVCHTLDDYC